MYMLLQVNDNIAEFEQEKFEMQKQHTRNIQELLDDTNDRLHKMETEYNQQSATTVGFSHSFAISCNHAVFLAMELRQYRIVSILHMSSHF